MKFRKLSVAVAISSLVIFTNIACGLGAKLEAKSVPSAMQEQEIIPLKFKPITIESNIISIMANKIQKVIKEYNIDGNKYIIFIEKDDMENLHSGVIVDNKIYDFGKVSLMNTDLFSVKGLELYGKQLVKINGILGANYAPTNYYYIDNQVPTVFLHSEGHTKEIDLDDDGIQEIVASTSLGVASSTDIYKYENGSFSITNLNEALNAITVYPTEADGKVFEAYLKDQPNQLKNYEYTKGGLKEIK